MQRWRQLLLGALALVTVGALAAALRLQIWALLALPVLAVGLLQVIYDYRPLFLLLIFSIPWSLHLELGSSLAVDLPTEPLMLLFTGIFLFEAAAGRLFSKQAKIYPFHWLVFLLLFWTLLTSITSAFPDRSFKFLLAKLWYVLPLVYLAERLIRRPEDVRQIFWAFFVPMVLVVMGIILRHATEGFSFESANGIAYPLFANGVVYSATLTLFIPWCWYVKDWYPPKSLQWWAIVLGMGLLVVAAILTYKRGAWLALALMPLVDFAMKRRLLDKAVLAGLVVLVVGLFYLLQENRYYQFAPNYKKVIWHEGDLQGHLSATLEGQEISSMERFYRWVAAKNMIADLPIVGSGPSTFNQVYKRYADAAFRTYVSDNPEQSTTHNYFLLTFAEQGWIGGLLFLGLCLYMFVKAGRLYLRVESRELRRILLLANVSFAIILWYSLLNELIEVDKVGAFFWLCLLLIHKVEVWHEQGTFTPTR